MNRLTAPINRFEGMTTHEPRPSRQATEWRYLDEGSLVLAQDQWDTAEQVRQHWQREGERVDRDIAARAAAQAKAEKERSDAVINNVFRDRYLAAGGDLATFEKDLPELRREHAKRVALGLDQPTNSLDVLKEQLRTARARMNFGAAPDPATQP
jgi:hypothetical protein